MRAEIKSQDDFLEDKLTDGMQRVTRTWLVAWDRGKYSWDHLENFVVGHIECLLCPKLCGRNHRR